MVGIGAFVLIIVGTLGLLMNDIWLDLGRTATLVFAAIDIVGLVGVGITLVRNRRDRA